jgi:hypothetical protein
MYPELSFEPLRRTRRNRRPRWNPRQQHGNPGHRIGPLLRSEGHERAEKRFSGVRADPESLIIGRPETGFAALPVRLSRRLAIRSTVPSFATR